LIHIHPNPGNGIFYLDIDTRTPGPVALFVSNAANAIVFREDDPLILSHRSKTINLSFLPDGIYLLSLTTVNGTTTHKLILRK
jgi:hypothetical protein